MSIFTHEDQQRIWDEEHTHPKVLLQMDSQESSGGVVRFLAFLRSVDETKSWKGLEMCCGKGRNVIWLAQQDAIASATGFDFSPFAITEATRRALRAGVSEKSHFISADATKPWPFENASFDFVIDCFGSTDIETATGRSFANSEALRVLRPQGYLFVYTLSIDDEFHKEMIDKHPSSEPHAFHHPTGKFEKTFDEKDLEDLHSGFKLLESKRIEKTAVFAGKPYYCKHFWNIYQKP